MEGHAPVSYVVAGAIVGLTISTLVLGSGSRITFLIARVYSHGAVLLHFHCE